MFHYFQGFLKFYYAVSMSQENGEIHSGTFCMHGQAINVFSLPGIYRRAEEQVRTESILFGTGGEGASSPDVLIHSSYQI